MYMGPKHIRPKTSWRLRSSCWYDHLNPKIISHDIHPGQNHKPAANPSFNENMIFALMVKTEPNEENLDVHLEIWSKVAMEGAVVTAINVLMYSKSLITLSWLATPFCWRAARSVETWKGTSFFGKDREGQKRITGCCCLLAASRIMAVWQSGKLCWWDGRNSKLLYPSPHKKSRITQLPSHFDTT